MMVQVRKAMDLTCKSCTGGAKLIYRPPTYTRLLEGEINLGQVFAWLQPNGGNEEHNRTMSNATFWNQFGINSEFKHSPNEIFRRAQGDLLARLFVGAFPSSKVVCQQADDSPTVTGNFGQPEGVSCLFSLFSRTNKYVAKLPWKAFEEIEERSRQVADHKAHRTLLVNMHF